MTIRSLIEKWAKELPDATLFKYNEDKVWKTRSYADALKGVREVAEGYGARFALKPHEENAAIILGNSPTWVEAYLAQVGTGAAVVPIDPKLHNDEVEYILKDAEVRVVTTDTQHLRMMLKIAKNLPCLRGVVVVGGVIDEGQQIDGRVDVIGYEALRVAGGGRWYDEHVADEGDIASIIYTSGTTGKPKGAMLTHKNFVSDIDGALRHFGHVTHKDSFFVVLPLFHAYSFTVNFVCPMMVGASMLFNQSLRTVGQDIKDLKPTVLCAVPLLAEKLPTSEHQECYNP